MLPHLECEHLIATDEWLAEHREYASHGALVKATATDIQRVSDQKSPQPVMAVFRIPPHTVPAHDGKTMTLALDTVQNPGNLGTIIRLADWFGITQIVASRGTADTYNPKVVQATMGALVRVRVSYVDNLAEWLGNVKAPVIGTFLDGTDLYHTEVSLNPAPVIVMGNEGNGISPEVAAVVTHRLLIPNFPPGRKSSESLNVAMATGIIVSELSRRIYG